MAELKQRGTGSTTKSSTPKAQAETKKEAPKTRTDSQGRTVKPAKPVGNAAGLRVGAVILWLCAIAFEVVGILMLFGKLNITFMPTLASIIAVLVLDLICVIIGSALWKKANHIDPASEKNKVKFWLWNNMGLIVAIFAFLPYLVLLIKEKDKLDPKTRMIAIIAAAIALLIGGLTSVDYNPVSQEQKQEAVETITDNVYWTQFGRVYHMDDSCQHINHSDSYYEGTVEEAIAEGRTRLCKTCARNHGISTVATDE